jgi:hypothetical protein
VFRTDIQGAWLLSFMMWLVLDAMLNTLTVITTHVLLPSSITSSILNAKNKLKVSTIIIITIIIIIIIITTIIITRS